MARLENAEIAALFAEVADLIQIKGGDRHRVMAFRRVSRIIEALPRPVDELLRHGELGKVKGIGEGTIHRIKQILRRGSFDDLDKLRDELPPGLRELTQIKGIGAITVRNLYNRLGVRDIDELERAARMGLIDAIPRMGSGTAHKILAGIEAYRERRGKVPLVDAQRIGRRIVAAMRELPQALRVELAGSVRRGKAAIGDLDVLVATNDPGPVAARFQQLPEVREILLAGDGRCSVRLENGIQADLRMLPPETFGAGLHYFTGSKLHNIEIRKRANKAGLKVSDKGVFIRMGERGDPSVEDLRIDPCPEEADVFRRLGLPWIPPELRENLGEIEAAERGRLPALVEAGDLRGDLHMHTTDTDGRGTIRAMATRARELGLEYIAITDHSKAMHLIHGLDERRLAEQMARVRAFAAEFEGVRVLAGVEVDILRDGALDLDPALLAQLDWVVASVHRWTDMSEAAMTERVVRAIESGVVDCIGHPTGRRPGKRDPFPIDLERVIRRARELDVALECNGGPTRMDLGDVECHKCRERGVAVVLNTDAHAPEHLGRMEFALAMARRGWLERKDVLNAWGWEVIAERRRKRLRDHGDPHWGVVPVVVSGVGLGPRESDASGGDDEASSEANDAHAWGVLDDVEPPVRAGVVEASVAGIVVEVRTQQVDRFDEASSDGDAIEDEAPEPVLEPVLDEQTIGRLAERLAGPLDAVDEALSERLAAWVTGGAVDPELEQALARGSSNPLQAGFDLLMQLWNRG